MPELWQHVLRTPDGDATFDRMSYSEEVSEYDVDERRPPFSESPFFLGTGLPKPIEVTFKIRLRGATMGDAEQELANLLYVLQNVTNWIYQGRIASAQWTGAHNIQPTFLGYIVTFNLTLGDVAAFDGEIIDIDDPPVEPESESNCETFNSYADVAAFEAAYDVEKTNNPVLAFNEHLGGRFLRLSVGATIFPQMDVEAQDVNIGSFTDLKVKIRLPQGEPNNEIRLRGAVSGTSNVTIRVVKIGGSNPGYTVEALSGASAATAAQIQPPVGLDPVLYQGGNVLVIRMTFDNATGYLLGRLELEDGTLLYQVEQTYAGMIGATGTVGWRQRAVSNESFADIGEFCYPAPSNPPPVSDPDPTPVGGLVLALPALGDFQARGGAGASKVAYSQFSRVPQALNRIFDAGSPSNFNHPSIGSFSIRQSGADKIYFFCYTEIFEVTNAASLTIVSRGSNGLGASTYDRNFQWSRVVNNQYYAVRNGDLLRFTVGSLTPTTLCSRARVLAELSLSAFDSQAVRWGGPGEMTIVSNADGLGKEMAFGYVRTGASALTVFAYNVTDDDILGTVQNITFTTEAELYFDYVGVSVQGDFGIMKPRPQSSNLNVRYWIFPLTLSGVGARILGASSISTGHASFGLTKSGSTYIDGFYTFTDENFNLLNLSNGAVALNKAIEGQWSQHIGHVYWTHGFVSYDSSGRAAFEFSDGSGGYGLGDGWDTQGYVQMYYDKPTGDVFVMGRRNGLPEIRYWDA